MNRHIARARAAATLLRGFAVGTARMTIVTTTHSTGAQGAPTLAGSVPTPTPRPDGQITAISTTGRPLGERWGMETIRFSERHIT